MATQPGNARRLHTPWQPTVHKKSEPTLKDSSAYHPVNIQLSGISKLKDEDIVLYRGEEIHPGHSINLYRNNLIACSQRYNLLFVATRAKIRVYSPVYPSQNIGKLILTLHGPEEVQGLRRQGYIEQNKPHIVNNMIVTDLGDDEILLVANDSGYVCMWYTKYIIQRQGAMSVWFDVFDSAWGLSVHKTKRVIGVSSNSHKIYLFEMGNEGIDPAKPPTGALHARVVPGHGNNIPGISFLQEDPTARWLCMTDICGEFVIYDLWTGLEGSSNWKGQGWTVTWISESDLLLVDDREFKELIQKAREESERALGSGLLSFALDQDEADDLDEPEDDASGWESDVQMVLNHVDSDEGDEEENDDEDSDSAGEEEDEDEMSDDEDLGAEAEMDFTALEEAIVSRDSEYPPNESSSEDLDGSEVTEEMQDRAYGPQNLRGTCDYEPVAGAIWRNPPPSFIIHSKEFDLKLLTPYDPTLPSKAYSYAQSLITRKHLIPSDNITLAARASRFPLRMNMTAYIPALSLYIVGRQDGRAALVRLMRSRPPIEGESAEETGQPATDEPRKKKKKHRELRHFMQLEHIIPTNIMVSFALAGVCAAPLQGWEDRDVKKPMGEGEGQGRWIYSGSSVGGRWRIFLLYTDGTVVCYTVSGSNPPHETMMHI